MERYRIVQGIAVYYITFTVVDWLPVFVDETARRIITDSLNFCIRNKFLGVNAYVIIPEETFRTSAKIVPTEYFSNFRSNSSSPVQGRPGGGFGQPEQFLVNKT